MKKLTIGSAVYDDFEGVYFSYQSLRLNNLDIKDDLDFVIIDNNPESAEGKATKHFCETTQCIRYIPFTEKRSTAVRNEIFNNAKGKFCMSIDCHVLFEPETIKRLIDFFDKNPESDDLYHGPMLYDVLDGHAPVTHMDPKWRDNMFGTWGYATKGRGDSPEDDPFEIPMHGLGIFAARTKSWMGFNDDFKGFGGEEGYIHKKYKKNKRRIWCLPFLRWVHRFDRPRGIQYPLIIKERIRNYLIGHRELGIPYDDIIEHFGETQPHVNIQEIIDNLDNPESPKLDVEPETENKDDKKYILPQKITSWQDSVISFKTPSNFRYLNYEIYDSYDGHAALQKFNIEPVHPKNAKIISFSSESENAKAKGFLTDGESWQSNPKNRGQFPHFLTIDLQEEIEINKITTFARIGMQPGLPKKFKVNASNDLNNWYQLSDVDIMKENS